MYDDDDDDDGGEEEEHTSIPSEILSNSVYFWTDYHSNKFMPCAVVI
jgi:hypothetical protein